MKSQHQYNGSYSGRNLDYAAFPLGGLGAGMLCLEGTGMFSHVSLRHTPKIPGDSPMFATLCLRDEPNLARVLEGPIPTWKIFGLPATGNGGLSGAHFGLPRFASASLHPRFPFATVTLQDPHVPLRVEIVAWSPFVPGDADNSSLPVASLEYRFHNPGQTTVEAVFAFHSSNLMKTSLPPNTPPRDCALPRPNGFVLQQAAGPEQPWEQGSFCIEADAPGCVTDCAWYRGGLFDTMTMLWNTIMRGVCPDTQPLTDSPPSPGASIYQALTVKPGETISVRLRLCWHVPESNLRLGKDAEDACSCRTATHYSPWYAGRFADIEAVADYWRDNYAELHRKSELFSNCFFDTTLPPEAVEAIAANLTILKSPTILRQQDGRIWCWEGCCDTYGCCHGSCTHVWNYAQAIAHLFPDLERSLRQTEFFENQNAEGHQQFRARLPIRENSHDFHAAADGQLGGIMKVYRDWRISGDTDWLQNLWPKVRASLDFCIRQWDPDRKGTVVEPHHNTYDIEFWGPDGMCTSFYLGALRAATAMGEALKDDVREYQELAQKAQRFLEKELFNGDYFEQRVEWRTLKSATPEELLRQKKDVPQFPEELQLLAAEGPKYQYGTGCLADGVLGAWLAAVCGIEDIMKRNKLSKHLRSVFRHNFKKDLSQHANPQRPGFALGKDGGLLLCTWPKGGKPSLPFIYSDEVWTGIEYHVAAHLMMMGRVREGLAIVRAARDRYDGTVRNPFNEYECGHWYARALSSYSLLQGLTGARYDAVEKVLYLRPSLKGDFKSFLATATGFGNVGLRDGQPFLDVKYGAIAVERIEATA